MDRLDSKVRRCHKFFHLTQRHRIQNVPKRVSIAIGSKCYVQDGRHRKYGNLSQPSQRDFRNSERRLHYRSENWII